MFNTESGHRCHMAAPHFTRFFRVVHCWRKSIGSLIVKMEMLPYGNARAMIIIIFKEEQVSRK